MTVLARDLDAYARALDAYKRQLASYNTGVDTYNQSLVTDSNGNPVVLYQGAYYAVPKDGSEAYVVGYATNTFGSPTGYDQYAVTQSANDANVQLLRQNPTATNTTNYDTVYVSYPNAGEGNQGDPAYYTLNADGTMNYLSPRNTQITGTRQIQTGVDDFNQPVYQTVYTAAVNSYDFVAEPGEFTGQLRAKRPDPTFAQMRKLGEAGLADQERGGLLSDVIRGNGLAAGYTGRVQGGTPIGPPEPEPVPEQPVDPPPPIDWFDPGGTGGP